MTNGNSNCPTLDSCSSSGFLNEESLESNFALTQEEYDLFVHREQAEDHFQSLLSEYRKYAEMFQQRQGYSLPPHRSTDHEIRLVPNAVSPYNKGYPMNADQLAVLKQYLDEQLNKGTIEKSSSPCAAPVLLVKKPNGGFLVCVDYRALNAVTVRNRYPIPLIRESLDRLSTAVMFTKLDIVAAFNNLRMKSGNEYLTAFTTRYGLYQYNVLPFGLCNGPSTWQAYMNDVFREYLDSFVTVYLDDILVYSDSLEQHRAHVTQVLERLAKESLPVDLRKSEFHVTEVKYVGMIVTTSGLKMDPTKIEAVTKWDTPMSVKAVQAFLGFANFYRRFIPRFSELARPLTQLTRKDVPFVWCPACETAFSALKTRFTSAPILQHFQQGLETWVETDASDHVVAGILSQVHPEGLKPVAYFSRQMVAAECNYDIYDKELMAIVKCLEEWEPELLNGSIGCFRILSDHKNLECFMTTKRLNRRQARWSAFLSQFHFRISYRPGSQNGKPDSLTRRQQDLPSQEDDDRHVQQHQVVLKPEQVDLAVMLSDSNDTEPEATPANQCITDVLRNAYDQPSIRSLVHDLSKRLDTADRCKWLDEHKIAKEECSVSEDSRIFC